MARPRHPLNTARRRLTGAVAGLRERLGADAVPRSLTTQARHNLTAYARAAADAGQRHRGGERGQAPAATVTAIDAMVDTCDTSLAGLRDRAMILIGFAIAARRSETAGLLAGDITADLGGLVVAVHTSKRLSSRREVAVPYSPHTGRCPVRAWTAWRVAAGLEDADPAFTPIDRHGRMSLKRLSPQAIGDIITRRAAAGGIDDRLTGHSLRAGLATESRRARTRPHRHRSPRRLVTSLARPPRLHPRRRPLGRQRRRRRPVKKEKGGLQHSLEATLEVATRPTGEPDVVADPSVDETVQSQRHCDRDRDRGRQRLPSVGGVRQPCGHHQDQQRARAHERGRFAPGLVAMIGR